MKRIVDVVLRFRWLILFLFTLLLWFFNVSRPGLRVSGCFQGCSTIEPRVDNSIRILSLNMFHGHPDFEYLPQRLDLIAREIQRLEADIILLQEVPWRFKIGNGAEYIAGKTGLNYAYYRANGNRWTIFFEEGEAILSRYPLTDISFTELKPKADFFEHRVVLKATAETPLGYLDLYVTHLTDGAEAINQAQTESLIAFVESSATNPAVVAGDFNARVDEPHIVALSQDWIDSYRAVHPDDPGFTSSIDNLTAGPEETLEKCIDYIFIVPGDDKIIVMDAQIVFEQPFPAAGGWLWASDHAGVLIIIGR